MLESLLLLFLMVPLSFFIVTIFPKQRIYLLSIGAVPVFFYFLYNAFWVKLPYAITIPWFEALGISFSFYLDGLSLLFAILISGIGIFILAYSAAYLKKHPLINRFYGYLFFFMAAMLGLVLSNNLITLFMFWELTAVSSYLLIAFDDTRAEARQAALTALLITSAGGLALITGFLLIGAVAQTFELTTLLQQPEILRGSSYYPWILLCIIIGACSKSAQFPLHFWLPRAMEAPTPVSAYLHSATMVQAGIYLLARIHPLLAHTQLWFISLTTIGGITMLVGIWLALRENDIKLVLAYTTVSALGSMVFMLASDQRHAIKSCIAFIFAHALYKAALFMAAGNIEHETGSRELYRIHGLARSLPITFITVCIAAASMGGLPPLLGFYVKELVYEAAQAAPFFSQLLIMLVVVNNMGLVMLALLMIIKPFLGKQTLKNLHEPPPLMWLSCLVMAIATLFLGLFPFVIDQKILGPAATAVLHYPVDIKLALWHGFSPSLVLSVITFLGGIIFYLQRVRLLYVINAFRYFIYYGPEFIYQNLLRYGLEFAEIQTSWIQNGRLTIYLLITWATTGIVLGAALLATPFSFSLHPTTISWFSMFFLFWLLVAALGALNAKELIIAIIFLGAFGMGVALLFLMNQAPDLAMTQVLVETLFVIIFVLAFDKLRDIPTLTINKENKIIWTLRVLTSVVIGSIVAILLIVVTNHPLENNISRYFIENSVVLGHGLNIVNVILVDFRAFDTMGESIVIVIAALGVYGLLRTKAKSKETWL